MARSLLTGGSPMTIGRRTFLLAAAMAPLTLGGCVRVPDLNARMPWDARTVSGPDDALALMTEELGERFGREFAEAPDPNPYDGADAGMRTISFDLTPGDDPSKVFSATVLADTSTGAVRGGVLCDWPQYLFRDRFLGPFRDALAGAEGLAGWGVAMSYVRYDARAWRDSDYDDYVGTGQRGEPEADAFLLLPRDGSKRQWAETIAQAGDALYRLGRSIWIGAAKEGDSFEKPPYVADQKYRYASERSETPTADEVEDSLEDWSWDVPEDKQHWDGASTGGDPGSDSYLPQITWNPGHGPETW